MRLSTVALLTLAALVAQDSSSEASSVADENPNAFFTSSEPSNRVDPVDEIALTPTLAVSVPELIESPSFAPSSSEGINVSLPMTTLLDQTWLGQWVKMTQVQETANIVSPVSLGQINPASALNADFRQTITLLNTLLIVATLIPSITLLSFWLVRRLVVKEIVAQARKQLNQIDHLETQLKLSKQRYHQLIQDLEAQVSCAQESINFLTREAKLSKSSMEQVETLKSQFVLRLQGMISEVQDLQYKAVRDLEEHPSIQPSIPVVQKQPVLNQIREEPDAFDQSSSAKALISNAAVQLEKPENSQSMIGDDYFKQGEALFNEGKYTEALALLEKAIQTNQNLDEAWYKKASVLVRLQRYADALVAYEKLVTLQPQKYEGWYNRGNVLVRLQRYSEAIESYDKALEIKPDDYESWHNRGALLRKFKRFDEALASYEQALKISPEQYETWHNKGNVLAKLNRYEEAIAAYDKALQIHPGKWELWSNRANALAMLKQDQDALASYQKALELKPNEGELWKNQAAILGKLNQIHEALASYEKAIQLKIESYEVWLGTGEMLGKLQRYSEAIAAYEKAIKLKPDSSEAWRSKGMCLEKLEQYPEALASYDAAISCEPEDADSWRYRGALLSKLKQYPEAISSLGKAISIQKELRGTKTSSASSTTSEASNPGDSELSVIPTYSS